MLELLIIVLSLWLSWKFLGLAFRVTWGAAKIIAGLLFALALPLLVVCVLFAGGLVLLLPAALIALAVGIVRSAL